MGFMPGRQQSSLRHQGASACMWSLPIGVQQAESLQRRQMAGGAPHAVASVGQVRLLVANGQADGGRWSRRFSPEVLPWQADPVMRSLHHLAVILILLAPLQASTQPPSPSVGEGRVVLSDTIDEVDSGLDDLDGCQPGQCCPPNSAKKITMGAAAVAIFLSLFFVLVRLMERAFIRSERSPLFGRHVGVSLALVLGGGAVCGTFFVATGCWSAAYTWWAGFFGIVWALHLTWVLITIRK